MALVETKDYKPFHTLYFPYTNVAVKWNLGNILAVDGCSVIDQGFSVYFHLASNVAWIILRIVVATLCGFGVLFIIAPTSLNRAFVNGRIFAAVSGTFFPLLMLGQERSYRVASDLALLIRGKRYIEFARQLEGAQGLSHPTVFFLKEYWPIAETRFKNRFACLSH